ncbi:MAG: hypothetical protein JSU03_00455 [Bacteroidetes bacterium]|nr:hypothetical protein [Bacteroidota bacterium]MBS1755722.1 hypothetical protein [Bacteroidota bacterium]
MIKNLFKWFLVFAACFTFSAFEVHPIYVSVTEINHNAKAKTLEVSCKIFTDDFETALRNAYHLHIDLLSPKDKQAINKLVSDYVQKHLQIRADGHLVTLKYLGYEQIEEGIYSYFQVDGISSVKSITVTDNLLYEYQQQQINLVHITVNGKRKSTKLNNPEQQVTETF